MDEKNKYIPVGEVFPEAALEELSNGKGEDEEDGTNG